MYLVFRMAIVFVSLTIAQAAFGQQTLSKHDPRLVDDRPGVYVDCDPSCGLHGAKAEKNGESVIILRMHNNLPWAISIDAESEMTEGDQETVSDHVVSVNYEFEDTSFRAGRMRFRELSAEGMNEGPKKQIVRGRSNMSPDLKQVVVIPAGQWVRFSVRAEHLKPNFAINIRYRFAWENDDGRSEHRVIFYASDLRVYAKAKFKT